jgi:hypothetical protein
MTLRKKQRTKSELILDAWKHVDSNSAGARELEFIQKQLENELGGGAVESPASVARTLADAGIRLRHPEILQADSRWRESRMDELFGPGELGFDTLDSALESMAKIETLRQQFVEENDEIGIKRLLYYGKELRKQLELQKGPGSILAAEVIQWLAIWLQTPELLDDWLALRRNSADFARKFGV